MIAVQTIVAKLVFPRRTLWCRLGTDGKNFVIAIPVGIACRASNLYEPVVGNHVVIRRVSKSQRVTAAIFEAIKPYDVPIGHVCSIDGMQHCTVDVIDDVHEVIVDDLIVV